MTKSNQNLGSHDFPPAPMFYADQPAALLLGPHVSRITFGVEEEDDGDFPRPVVTIAMPTASLLEFANDLKAALDSPGFKKHAVDQLSRSAKKIATGGAATPETRKITRVRGKNQE